MNPVTLGSTAFAIDFDVLDQTGCASGIAVVFDLTDPYYSLDLVAERGQPFRLVENHKDRTTGHDGSSGVSSGWSHIRCEVGFAPALASCFVDGQRVLDQVPITPTRDLPGRPVELSMGVNYDGSPTGCSVRMDNYVFSTW